jgi:hypothetical protein
MNSSAQKSSSYAGTFFSMISSKIHFKINTQEHKSINDKDKREENSFNPHTHFEY